MFIFVGAKGLVSFRFLNDRPVYGVIGMPRRAWPTCPRHVRRQLLRSLVAAHANAHLIAEADLVSLLHPQTFQVRLADEPTRASLGYLRKRCSLHPAHRITYSQQHSGLALHLAHTRLVWNEHCVVFDVPEVAIFRLLWLLIVLLLFPIPLFLCAWHRQVVVILARYCHLLYVIGPACVTKLNVGCLVQRGLIVAVRHVFGVDMRRALLHERVLKLVALRVLDRVHFLEVVFAAVAILLLL